MTDEEVVADLRAVRHSVRLGAAAMWDLETLDRVIEALTARYTGDVPGPLA